MSVKYFEIVNMIEKTIVLNSDNALCSGEGVTDRLLGLDVRLCRASWEERKDWFGSTWAPPCAC